MIAEKLQEFAGMGPAAVSRYSGRGEPQKKQVSKKPSFPTLEEQESRRRLKEHKKKVVHHQEESIGKRYISLKRQAMRYDQEI